MVMVPTDALPGSSPVSSALTAFYFCHKTLLRIRYMNKQCSLFILLISVNDQD